MRKAIAHTAAYDTAISATLTRSLSPGTTSSACRQLPRQGLPRRWTSAWRRFAICATARTRISAPPGIGPSALDDWRPSRGEGLGAATILQGKELSFTNLLDLDAAARIVLEFDEPAAAVIKHTNPCGVAIGDSAADAYVRAREADSLSAFGGIVALNRPIDVRAAEAIVSTFIEAVIAPGVEADAHRCSRKNRTCGW